MEQEVGIGSAFEVEVIKATPSLIEPTTTDWLITILFFAFIIGLIYFIVNKARSRQTSRLEENEYLETKEEDKEWRR